MPHESSPQRNARAPTLLGPLDPRAFLDRYWQREPLLIRQALPDFTAPVGTRDLFALACDENIESRLVVREKGAYRLEHGPFDSETLEGLPSEDWTLLVQDVDKVVASVRGLVDAAAFLPLWRIDDVMVSTAVAGGGVGPHVDSYDVFLVQGAGRRRWEISREFDASEIVHPGGLKTVPPFVAEDRWELEAGDVLYLPPGIAHDGVALDACMTFSVGLRAPTTRELLIGLADFALEEAPAEAFGDAGRHLPLHRGELDAMDRARLRAFVRRAAALPDPLLDRFLGRLLSEAKGHLLPEAGRDIAASEVSARLDAGDGVRLLPACRALFVGDGPEVSLFVAGTEHTAPRALAMRLTEGSAIRLGDLPADAFESCIDLLTDLFHQGFATCVTEGP